MRGPLLCLRPGFLRRPHLPPRAGRGVEWRGREGSSAEPGFGAAGAGGGPARRARGGGARRGHDEAERRGRGGARRGPLGRVLRGGRAVGAAGGTGEQRGPLPPPGRVLASTAPAGRAGRRSGRRVPTRNFVKSEQKSCGTEGDPPGLGAAGPAQLAAAGLADPGERPPGAEWVPRGQTACGGRLVSADRGC